MPRHLEREIDKLKKQILALCAAVEGMLELAVQSVRDRDAALAAQVIDMDTEIDEKEVDIEETCLQMLALYQPVATDLRYIIAILKINNDMERIGDEAVNIAERAAFLADHARLTSLFDFSLMAQKTLTMLRESLDALMTLDSPLARRVGAADDDVDALNRQMYQQVQNAMVRHPEQVECLVHILSISRHLERIADYATNISEDVVYMIEGEITRHKTEAFR